MFKFVDLVIVTRDIRLRWKLYIFFFLMEELSNQEKIQRFWQPWLTR